MYTIRQTKNMELVASLDKEIFPDDTRVVTEGAVWWVAYKDGRPVAFAGISRNKNYWFLRRAGVLEEHRGNGLQKRLIKIRLNYAKKKEKSIPIYTYTVLGNPASSNSLISTGFRLYEPSHPYVGKSLYWRIRPDNKGR